MAKQEEIAYKGEDLLDCSRYGEVDDVKVILASGVDVNHQDNHGNTALHLSCANGHVDVVRVLIEAGATYLSNTSGNRPLHWAVQNKHVDCVKALLELYPGSDKMDVMEKNSFGKSALSDAFISGDADVVKMILSHKSAEEDMLISQSSLKTASQDTKPKPEEKKDEDGLRDLPRDATPATADAAGSSGSSTESPEIAKGDLADETAEPCDDSPSVTHELGFDVGDSTGDDDEGITFHMRELLIRDPDECFGEDATKDTTGLCLWASAMVLARWMASPEMRQCLEGKTVVELGAGCGAGGISAAVHGRPARVIMTDLNKETMANLRYNIDLNRQRYPPDVEVRAETLDWEDESTWSTCSPPLDVVLTADLVYQATVAPALLRTILSLLKPGGLFLNVYPISERDGLEGFLAKLGVVEGNEGTGDGTFDLISVRDAPREYRNNPLVSGSEEEYILHFNELPGTTFRLLELRKLL